jgi:FdhE protein
MKVAGLSWQDKIERLQLLTSHPDAPNDVLTFYAKILHFQRNMQSHLGPGFAHGFANAALDGVADGVATVAAPFVPELLELLTHSGTPQTRELAASSMALDWPTELDAYWNERLTRPYAPLSFILLTLLQPFARQLASQLASSHAPIDPQLAPHCPFCFCKPQLGILRPEGDGGKRFLLCTLCGTEWEYRRVICPNCGELDKEKLPVYKSDKVPHIKLAACDTCHTYLKCIDLGIDGNAIPEADDIATLPMSLWMVEKGFQPLRLNLFGF